MAKAKRAFFGTNSSGTSIEVAESETGKWFFREYGFNGRGKSWSAWKELEEAPKLTTRVFSHYQDCYVDLAPELAGQYLDWGFKQLHIFSEVPRYRLPD